MRRLKSLAPLDYLKIAVGLATLLAMLVVGLDMLRAALSASNQSPAGATRLPVLVGAGDIGGCQSDDDEATAAVLDRIRGTIFTVGDNVSDDGTLKEYRDCYDPTWGRHKRRIRPSPGDHDYGTSDATPYYTYFLDNAGPPGRGYYSYNLATWHVVVLNSNIAVDAASDQVQWLRADLAANPAECAVAYWHHPAFSSGIHGDDPRMHDLWQVLFDHGVDVVINGHDHDYERFAPQDPDGNADPNGIRQFVVGTGGEPLTGFETIHQNSEVRDSSSLGVMKLTLNATSYNWQFVPAAGGILNDAGEAPCANDNRPTDRAVSPLSPSPTPFASTVPITLPEQTESLAPKGATPNTTQMDLAIPPMAVRAQIKNITFEKNNLVHETSGVDNVRGMVTLETSAPIEGMYAARLEQVANAYLEEDFPAADDLDVTFYLRLASLPTRPARIALLSSAGVTMGNLMLGANGTLMLRHEGTKVGFDSFPLKAGEVYRVRLRYRKGTGANAVLAAYLAHGDADWDQPFAATTTGIWTAPIDRLRIGSTTRAILDATVDDIRLETGSIPAPFPDRGGSAQPDRAARRSTQ